MWGSQSVWFSFPYSMVKHSLFPACVFLSASVLLFYASVKTGLTSGSLLSEAESNTDDPTHFKVTTHQLESQPAHIPRQGQSFSQLM